jgi:hypothetical protein
MTGPLRTTTLTVLALLALPLQAAADNAKGQPQTKAPSANVPQPAALNALKPDLAVSFGPDLQGSQWPSGFIVRNIGGTKSEDEYLRIGVFVVGEDPVTKKSCIPRYTGSDTLIKGLAPNESKVVQPVGLNPTDIKYMPAAPNAPPPVVKDGLVKCTFQVGASLANNGKNDANYANDQVIRNLTVPMPAKP